jgi:CubicO group peptidase (beta-lactamase class C family)
MKTTVTITVLFLAIAFNSFSQKIHQKIDSILKITHEKNPNISISLGFIKDNQQYFKAYGNLSRTSNQKVNENSLFEIASITKLVTGNLIAQAQLEQKLKITDFIDDYLPEAYQLHKNLQQKITIADLASHQSGLPDIDFRILIAENPQQPVLCITQKTITDLIYNATELKDYGNYRYSTVGFILLGQILETVYQKSYANILENNTLHPLQMRNTFTTNFNVANITTAYNPEGGTQEFFKWNITGPAGLIKSNAKDMITYIQGLLNTKSTLGLSALLSEKVQYNKNGMRLGLGLNILKNDNGNIYAKTGDSMGQSTILAYDRIHNWGIVIFLNQRNHKLRHHLFNTIFKVINTKNN